MAALLNDCPHVQSTNVKIKAKKIGFLNQLYRLVCCGAAVLRAQHQRMKIKESLCTRNFGKRDGRAVR
jgi:hypothetical protein